MKKIYTLIFFLMCITAEVIGQTSVNNLLKYWRYRERLQYFVSPGPDRGQSQIAGIRNRYNSSLGNSYVLGFGQHGTYFGYYLGVLSTEFYLLDQNNQDTRKTIRELFYALDQYINYMDKCENEDPWYKPAAEFDGYFRRSDVHPDFISNHPEINKGLENTTASPSGDGWPFKVETIQGTGDHEAMSQDEAIGILMGLALVKRFLPNYSIQVRADDGSIIQNANLYYMATNIAEKMIKFIRGGRGILPWYIINPDYSLVTLDKGGECLPFSHGFKMAGNYITNYPFYIYHLPDGPKTIWNLLSGGWFGNGNRHMISTLGAVGNAFFTGPTPAVLNFSALAIRNNSLDESWDAFYLLLRKVLHNTSDAYLSYQKALDQINSAPCNGPYRYSITNFSNNGWASTGKYWHSTTDQNFGSSDFEGNYNGLDYMLIFNLYNILKASELPPYVNKLNYELKNTTLPNKQPPSFFEIATNANNGTFMAFQSIETANLTITTNTSPIPSSPAKPGYVVLRAGEVIRLKEGFNVVQDYNNSGTQTYFHAYIEPFSCSGNGNIEKVIFNENLYDIEGINGYDSLYAIPQQPWPVLMDDMLEIPPDILHQYDSAAQAYFAQSDSIKTEETFPEVHFFPNPFADNFSIMINSSKEEVIKIEVFNQFGISVKEVNNKTINLGTNLINLEFSNISNGLYVCQITSKNSTKSYKIICVNN